MRRLERFWRALESLPGWCQTLPEWRSQLGEEWEVVGDLLRPTSAHGATQPCPGPEGDGCPRRIVEHPGGEFVAVCGAEPKRCDRVELNRQDVILYEVDLSRLAEPIGSTLGFRASVRQERSGCWYLGAYGAAGEGALPVYLASPVEPEDLESIISSLLLDSSNRFVLLTPTTRASNSIDLQRLARGESRLLALEDLLFVNLAGRLERNPSFAGTLFEAPPPADQAPTFRLAGDFWSLSFEGKAVQLKDSKGLRYLRDLLRSPGQEFHCSQLVAAEKGGEAPLLLSEGHERLDSKAWKDLREESRSLSAELEEARLHNNLARVEALEDQLETLASFALSSQGLGGRDRKDQDDRERLRKQVGEAIRRARRKIEQEHEALGRHLNAALSLGQFVLYQPESPVDWVTD
ncbi:MAG: hypothetical protein K0U98_05855 [Deltaproteobacteria bacterium]|nr:hypothetical protein [Deltaproteobacteria bacterium]